MPALVAGIHVFWAKEQTWMAGPSPAMTEWENYKSSTSRAGSSRDSFTRTKNVTASRPSTMR
jgi:hypothetical protein